MEEGTSWDQVLTSDETPAPEQEAPTGPARDEQGRFASASPQQEEDQGEQQQQEAPPASEPEPGHIPIAALKDERGKRQRAEDDLRQAREVLQQYEAHFAQASQQQPEQEQDPVEFLTQEVLARVQPQTQQQHMLMRVEVAEQFARQQWTDYDATVETFKEEAGKNPYLMREALAAQNPAVYAYNAGKNILAARTYGSEAPPSREQIEAEIREKIMAEIGVGKPAVPTSLANAQSRGSRGGPAWNGPTSWGDVLGS